MISRQRNQIALGLIVLLPLLSFVTLAQAPAHKRAAADYDALSVARVNVNCNAAAVYKRHTHTGDAMQVNFHANGICKLVNFSNPDIFGKTEIDLIKGDNFVDILDIGSTNFCVENQKCPPDAKPHKMKTGTDADSGRLVPATQTLRPVVTGDPNEIIVP
jgi:hypothetical protein